MSAQPEALPRKPELPFESEHHGSGMLSPSQSRVLTYTAPCAHQPAGRAHTPPHEPDGQLSTQPDALPRKPALPVASVHHGSGTLSPSQSIVFAYDAPFVHQPAGRAHKSPHAPDGQLLAQPEALLRKPELPLASEHHGSGTPSPSQSIVLTYTALCTHQSGTCSHGGLQP